MEPEAEEPERSYLKLDYDGTKTAGPAKLEQAVITSYFRPKETETISSGSSTDVTFLKVDPPPEPTVCARAPITGVGMRVVDTPLNGSCLLHAILHAISRKCGDRVDDTDATEKSATLSFSKDLYAHLYERLRVMIAVESLLLGDLVAMYLSAEHAGADPETQILLLLAHFRMAGKIKSLTEDRNFWGSAAEITAFVDWKRAPVYVLAIWPSGTTDVVLYSPVAVVSSDGTAAARVDREALSIEMFLQHLRLYKAQQVIPFVLLCHHFPWTGEAGSASSHFSAARVPSANYAAWSGNDKSRAAMTIRLHRVEALIQRLSVGVSIDELLSNGDAPSSDASEWLPGDSDVETSYGSTPAEATPAVSATDKVTVAEDTNVSIASSADSSMLDDTQVTQPSPDTEHIELELSQILSTPPEPGLSYSDIERFLPVSLASSAPDEEYLLHALRGDTLHDPIAKTKLATFMKATAPAYAEWVRRQAKANPPTYAIVKRHSTAIQACLALRDRPDALRALVRALPYPEVIVAQLPDDALSITGQHIVCDARIQMIHRVRRYMAPEAAGFCQEWATAISSANDLQFKWKLALDSGRWARLRGYAKTVNPPLPARRVKGVTDKQWTSLVAYLLVVPGNVPVYFQTHGLPMQSDALLVWLHRKSNASVLIAGARAVSEKRWTDTMAVIRHWNDQRPSLSVAAAIAHSSADDAVNVRGLAKDNETISLWFSGFRRKTDGRQADVVFLQETRATARWTEVLHDQHAREWGLRPEQLADPISFWQSTPTAAGGVAILLKPNGIVSNARPVWKHLWSPWFMAIQATVLGEAVTMVNVYGPSGKPRSREEPFVQLRGCDKPEGHVIMGGDFNCTLDNELDRSRTATHTTDSPGLHALLESWGLVDADAAAMSAVVTDADKVSFHAKHHTYRYSLRDGSLASSRLDRWYSSAARADRIVAVQVDPPVNHSDHDAVTLVYAVTPPAPVRGRPRRPRLQYPLPFGCRDAVTEITTAAISAFADEYELADGAISATAWVEMKTAIRIASLRAQRLKIRQQKRGMRQRRRRLQAALQAALYAAAPRLRPAINSVHDLTDRLEELELDPSAEVKSLRQAIIRLDRRRARARRRTTFAAYAAGTPEAERAFFRRFRVRQGSRTPTTMTDTDAAGRDVAERLAADWSTITQRGATAPEARDAFFAALPPLHATVPLLTLDDSFTDAEVRAALEACPRGKASGPDGLPNDWYRDHADLLVPVLTPLLNQWHRQQMLPRSFRHATVACIPKVSARRNGLDFRPIALLDTDYKIYSRLLLNRLGAFLPQLVARTQFGFVPGRQVHDALDVFHGLQAQVRCGEAAATSIAVLLDFAKAYDTLDRSFLLSALDRLGFPPGFRSAVEQMHLHTTAEYAADDTISEAQPVLNGIRQGCPLAPTLFILAVNTLYETIAADADVHGVQLPGGEEVCATGYADDTTCYLHAIDSLQPLGGVLDRFGTASGLHVNKSKCVVIFLGEQDPPSTVSSEVFPFAAPDQTSRLLGDQVATRDVSSYVWSLTLQQVRARLHRAEMKTTNELQRVKLLRAVLVPKYQRLVDDFVWGGSLAANGDRKRAWMSQSMARAPEADGGLHIPHLSHELQLLSLATIERWGQPASGALAGICQAFLRVRGASDGRLASSRRTAPTALSLQSTLVATGWQLRRSLATTPRDETELELLRPLLLQVGRGTSVAYSWEHGWLHCRYQRVEALLTPLRNLHGSEYGNVQIQSLLHARLSGEDNFLGGQLSPISTSDFPGLFRAADCVSDVVEIGWDAVGGIKFCAVRHEPPLAPLLSDHFRRLCDTIVFNYPGLLRPPAQPEDLIMRPPTLDVWRLRPVHGGYVLDWSPVEQATVCLGPVSSTADATAAARRVLTSTRCSFGRHAWLDAPFAIWSGVHAPTPTAARRLLRRAVDVRCEAEASGRHRTWTAVDADIADALGTVQWKTLLASHGTPSTHRLLFHKIKGNRLNGWDRVNERRGCPHCPALGTSGGDAFHIVWACPRAQDRWRQLLSFWDPLWTVSRSLHSPQTKTDLFSLRLQSLPDRLWFQSEITRLGTPSAQDTVATSLALNSVWKRHVLATCHTIWRWRTSPNTVDDIWSTAQARGRLDAALPAVARDVRWQRRPGSAATPCTAAAIDALFRMTDPLPSASGESFFLFFDGGSRGNPGPEGSGAVVVRVDSSKTQAVVVWSAAMARGAATTTSNQAEYHGLLTGLSEALRRRWTPLAVVGDSQLILLQIEQYRPPRNKPLLELYSAARRLADKLSVRVWCHHRRAYNSMADAAANVAIDSGVSSQVLHPTERAEHALIATKLANDFFHWQSANVET